MLATSASQGWSGAVLAIVRHHYRSRRRTARDPRRSATARSGRRVVRQRVEDDAPPTDDGAVSNRREVLDDGYASVRDGPACSAGAVRTITSTMRTRPGSCSKIACLCPSPPLPLGLRQRPDASGMRDPSAALRGGRDRRARNAAPRRTPRRSSSALVVQSHRARAAAWASTADASFSRHAQELRRASAHRKTSRSTPSVSALRRPLQCWHCFSLAALTPCRGRMRRSSLRAARGRCPREILVSLWLVCGSRS